MGGNPLVTVQLRQSLVRPYAAHPVRSECPKESRFKRVDESQCVSARCMRVEVGRSM